MMENFKTWFEHAIMCASFCGLGVVAALVAVRLIRAGVKWFCKDVDWVSKCVLAVFAICMLNCMATKPSNNFRITFEHDGQQGLFDNGSFPTNNMLCARWTYRAIPAEATVFIDYRPFGSDADWQNAVETSAGAMSCDYSAASAATNFEWYVWWYYDAPQPVHTNGVWEGRAYRSRNGHGYITINTAITDHGRVIATPEKTREE